MRNYGVAVGLALMVIDGQKLEKGKKLNIIDSKTMGMEIGIGMDLQTERQLMEFLAELTPTTFQKTSRVGNELCYR